MRKDVLQDVLNKFEEKQAYSSACAVNIAEFKDLKYSTQAIVTMIGKLIQANIVHVDKGNNMYLELPAWERYRQNTKKKMLAVSIFCGVLIVVMILLKMGGVI